MVNDRGWITISSVRITDGPTTTHGTLTVVPDADRFTPPRRLCRSFAPSGTGRGVSDMVFVCMDPTAPGLLSFLGPVGDLLAPYDLAGCR